MKFDVQSMARPRRAAKALRKALAGLGHDLPLSACQEAVARMYGHADWHALSKAPRGSESPADGDVAPEVAAARRERQEGVLTALGIPPAVSGEALDLALPTGRGGTGAVPVTPVPRLLVHARLTERDGTVREYGPQDITEPMVEDLVRYGLERFEEQLARVVPIYRVSASLSADARHDSGRKGFSFVGLPEAWARFKAEVGDLSDPRVARAFSDHVSFTRRARWNLDAAERMLRDAEAARFDDGREIEMFVPVEDHSDRFHSAPGDAYEGDLYDAYVAEVEKRPDAAWDSPAWRAWNARYAAWERERTPPFVWGTVAERWDGVSAESIREAAIPAEIDGETGKVVPAEFDTSVGDMIECDLTDNHHEDAIEHVKDWEGLAFLDEWLPHAGSGDEVDLGLEAKVEAWNAKQDIVSYREDSGTVVPVRKGITKGDIVAWCRDRVAVRRAELEASGLWRQPSFPAPASDRERERLERLDRAFAFGVHPKWRARGM